MSTTSAYIHYAMRLCTVAAHTGTRPPKRHGLNYQVASYISHDIYSNELYAVVDQHSRSASSPVAVTFTAYRSYHT
eukprot:6206470-Pleurochrysis_carterae.AAC.2